MLLLTSEEQVTGNVGSSEWRQNKQRNVVKGDGLLTSERASERTSEQRPNGATERVNDSRQLRYAKGRNERCPSVADSEQSYSRAEDSVA
jgi:hypothetical protein